ncbi:hypothetical protein [Alkaliphilus transvaalensis]|uniref:hypothetical protein n=1 Tax=Alkaliphilus transvaalensis TaxID=114628 RepID=UPI00047C7BC9|nr:hypothetical protein [Alkaliphilus transvaalensis]
MRDINGNGNKTIVIENGNTINGDNGIIANTLILCNGEKEEKVVYEVKRGKLNISWKAAIRTASTLSVVSFISLISSLITIFQSFKNLTLIDFNEKAFLGITSSTWIIISMMVFLFAFMIVVYLIMLKRKRIISIMPKSILSRHIGLFKDGKLGMMKLQSKCHIHNCGGSFRFEYDPERDRYFFVCKRNPSQHRFEFDFTKLEY